MRRPTHCCGRLYLYLAVLALCQVSIAHADVTGSVFGTVTDASHSVVPGALVKLENATNGLTRETKTDSAGAFEFLAIPAADGYTVRVEARGYKGSDKTGITLTVNARLREDFELSVGQATENVTVAANAAQVETATTQLGDLIDDKKMTDLPLNGRSYLDLLGLQAGVSPISVSGGNGNVSVNGQRENANGFMVNGGSVEDTGGNSAAVIPVLDSIQEFRVLTNSFDAEYGHFSGALVNAITKSGTNSLHGTAFEFLRNNVLDSRNYFDPVGPVGTFRQNQYGGVIGGPVVKDRLFFFGDYQGTNQGRAFTTPEVGVMSPAERTGDFSDEEQNLTGTVPGNSSAGSIAAVLSNRLGYPVTPGEPFYTSGCTTADQAASGLCVFPGAMIPQTAWSSPAIDTIKFIPTSSGNTFVTDAFLATLREEKFGVRVDLSTKRAGNWSMYYNFTDDKNAEPGNNPFFGYDNPFRSQQANLSDTLIIGSSTVNEFRMNGTRLSNPGDIPSGGLGQLSSFGFVEGGEGIVPGHPAIEGVPLMSFTEGLTLGANIPNGIYQNAVQITDNLSKIWGKHTFKFGGGFGYYEWDRRGGPYPNGTYSFGGSETGIDFVDYLIGIPTSFTQSSVQELDARSKMIDLFAQDSVRLFPNLTLNYGLRWEASEPWYDTKGRIQAFIPGQQSTVFSNAPTGWLFPGDKGIPKTLGYTRWNNIAPRIGIAYSPSAANGWLRSLLGSAGESSIRAGGGIFYTDFDTSGQQFATGDAPFGLFVNGAPHPYFQQPYTDYTTGANQLQPFPFAFPTGGSASFAPYQPIAFSPAFDTHNKLPYAINYNLTVQRALGRTTILTAGYVGTMGRHLFQQIANNLGSPQLCLQIASLGGGCGPGGEDSIYNVNGQTFNGTRQYSVTSGRYLSEGLLDFGDNSYESTIGTSSYNSLQLTLNKSVGAVHFLAAYTYGKALDYGSGFYDLTNPYNKDKSKGLSQFDLTQDFVVSYSYALPFAKLLSSQQSVAGRVIGGWQINGITRFTTGVPVTLTDSSNGDDSSLCGCDLYAILGANAVDVPNYNGSPIKIMNPRSNNLQYFDPSPFSFAAIGTQGNVRRRFLHGPGLDGTDLALVKTTRVSERVAFDFRVEFFNVFNHAQFNTPVGDINAGNFGAVTSAQDPRIGQGAIKISF